jgi:hypothetical protein
MSGLGHQKVQQFELLGREVELGAGEKGAVGGAVPPHIARRHEVGICARRARRVAVGVRGVEAQSGETLTPRRSSVDAAVRRFEP